MEADQRELAVANDDRSVGHEGSLPGPATSERSTRDVLSDHLHLAAAGDWRTDLDRNVADDIVVLTGFGVFTGRGQVRVLAELLELQLPDATFEYTAVVVHGEVGFLEWTARGPTSRVDDGADTFVVRDGRIITQTIHYTVELTGDGVMDGRLAGPRHVGTPGAHAEPGHGMHTEPGG